MPTVLSCPKCAAPLDFPSGATPNLRCPYCGSAVLLTGELSGAETAGSPLGATIGQAMKMAEIQQLIARKNKIAAIKLYRETFGTGLKEAKDAIDRIEAGKPVTISHTTFQTQRQVTAGSATGTSGSHVKAAKFGAVGCLSAIVLLSIGLVGGLIYFINSAGSKPSAVVNSGVPAKPGPVSKPEPAVPSYAAKTIEFGTEGIGAGQFKDARSIAIDPQGRVYVAEYTGGRLQVFDSQGKFLTQWTVDPKSVVLNIAADRKGGLYVVHPGRILKYDTATGEPIGELARVNGMMGLYSDLFVALDGNLYCIDNNSSLVQFGADGKLKRTLKPGDKTGDDSVSFERVAVSGLGEIYLLDNRKGVFKFASDGRYVDRFGFEGQDSGPGRYAFNLAIDGRGRVYISHADGISVYEPDGRYIGLFGDKAVVFGMAVDDSNSLWAPLRNKHTVVRYSLPAN